MHTLCRGRRSSLRHCDFRRSRAENRAASLKTPRCIRHRRRFGVFPRRPAAPSGAECRLNECSVAPASRSLPLAEDCYLVLPSATYFSRQRKVGKSCLSAFCKPMPRHVKPSAASIGAGSSPENHRGERRYAPPDVGWRGYLFLFRLFGRVRCGFAFCFVRTL